MCKIFLDFIGLLAPARHIVQYRSDFVKYFLHKRCKITKSRVFGAAAPIVQYRTDFVKYFLRQLYQKNKLHSLCGVEYNLQHIEGKWRQTEAERGKFT